MSMQMLLGPAIIWLCFIALVFWPYQPECQRLVHPQTHVSLGLIEVLFGSGRPEAFCSAPATVTLAPLSVPRDIRMMSMRTSSIVRQSHLRDVQNMALCPT